MTLLDGTRVELRRGLRAWLYRGRRRARGPIGCLPSGQAIHSPAYLH